MAARQPFTQAGGQQMPTSPIYDDFQPSFAWKKEKGADILSVLAPGFTKEQLKIVYIHASRSLRVVGERPLGSYRWERFNQSFPVPEYCDIEKIQAKILGGTMTIRFPKKGIDSLPPPEKSAPVKDVGKSPGSAKEKEDKAASPSRIPEIASPDAKTRKGTPETPQKPAPVKDVGRPSGVGKDKKGKEAEPSREMPTPEAKSPKATPKTLKRPAPAKDTGKKEDKEKEQGGAIESKKPEDVTAKTQVGKEPKAAKVTAGTKGTLKNLAEKWKNDEDRKVMVNMGAAALVILALGVYVSYNLGCGRNKS